MFKRLLSALSGKKSDTSTLAKEAPPAAEDLLTVYDAYGRELKVARSEWRENVFLPNLRKKWDNADELYGQIIAGLNDGFAADLLPAAARLLEIDANPERSHAVQGIVQMKNGQLAKAESSLRAGIGKAGPTGTLLTNLAKVFAERGEQAEADETLWRAVQADPNLENGLLWWASIQRERGGEQGYLDALRKAAALPGSWRAQCWLARHHLENKEFSQARALYTEVLEARQFDSHALTMISGDMGRTGQVAWIVELVGPAYDVQKHDPVAGLNVLRAYQELGMADEGETLVSGIYALGIAPLKQHLDQFAQAFQEMRKRVAKGTPVDADSLKIATLVLSQPIWHYGLRNADWLFAQKPEGSPLLGFFALSKMSSDPAHAESQMEDDIGRFSRAIPLYFAEAAHYWTGYEANCYMQVVEGGGPVLSGVEADGNALFDIVPPAMKYFVTGSLGHSEESGQPRWRLALSLWDCAARCKLSSEEGSAVQAELGGLVLELEKRLLAHCGRRMERPLDAFYMRPSAEAMPIYLNELGQAYMLTLLANGHMDKSSIWGERAMLEWPLNMSLHWPTVETPRIMYISGLGKAYDYMSDVLVEYKERSLQLLRESERSESPASRLAPLVWKVFGMQEQVDAYIQALPKDADPALVAWLKRI